MILNNVELYWAKLSPSNHDMGFSGDKPQWNVQIRGDKAQSEEWKSLGLNPKVEEGDSGVYYKIQVHKDAIKKDGQPNAPVPVVGADMFPLEDVGSVGNGSIANVKLRAFDWEFNGKTGRGVRLEAVQIVKLVVYANAVDDVMSGFKALDIPSQSKGDGTEDLY